MWWCNIPSQLSWTLLSYFHYYFSSKKHGCCGIQQSKSISFVRTECTIQTIYSSICCPLKYGKLMGREESSVLCAGHVFRPCPIFSDRTSWSKVNKPNLATTVATVSMWFLFLYFKFHILYSITGYSISYPVLTTCTCVTMSHIWFHMLNVAP